jgi:hypothetical protein
MLGLVYEAGDERTRAYHPVERMMAPVANVDTDFPVRRLKHRVAGVALHVVRALVEVAHARNVVFAVLADDVSVVAHHHRRIPNSVTVP